MKRHSDDPAVVTLRDVYDDLQATKRDVNKLTTRVLVGFAVVGSGIFGQWIGLSDHVSQAMPFK